MAEGIQLLIALNALLSAANEMGYNVRKLIALRELNGDNELTYEQLKKIADERDANLAKL